MNFKLLFSLGCLLIFSSGGIALNADPSAASVASSGPVFKSGDVLTITGDSITQMGLYSVFVEDYILMCQPVSGVKTIQCGWGGTTSRDMADQMKNGILTFSPTVATTAFGMNDGNFAACTPELQQQYRDGLSRMVDEFKASGTRTIIIGSPGAVDPDFFKNPYHATVTAADYNETLGKLAGVARETAAAKGVLFADLHTPMMETMVKAKPTLGAKFALFGGDGVHASPSGHLIMAYAFLKAMGFDGNIGTITYDAASGQTQATEGHRVVASKIGEVTLESTRYPYCFTHGNSYHYLDGPTEAILPYLPFNDALNRYILVVKNLKSAKAKITWGADSKEFTAAQLATGVNLAAEFLNNPFVPAFDAVDKEVTLKNDYQIFAVTFWLGQRMPALASKFPEKAASFHQVDSGLRDIDNGLLEDCAKAIKPVTHTIKIEAEN
jgi:lysophospholipase L1-like esterase